jgi:hypothetical protein
LFFGFFVSPVTIENSPEHHFSGFSLGRHQGFALTLPKQKEKLLASGLGLFFLQTRGAALLPAGSVEKQRGEHTGHS